MEFLRSFLRHHFARKPAWWHCKNVDCFLRLLQIYVFSVSVVNTHKKTISYHQSKLKSTLILCVSYQATDQNINSVSSLVIGRYGVT